MKCESCGKAGAIQRRVSRSYGSGAELLVIENVPVISCPACGERYLTAATLHAIVEVQGDRENRSHERPVLVAELG